MADGPEPRAPAGARAGLLAVAAVAAVTTVVGVLVVWAASVGPPTLLSGGSPVRGTATLSPTPSPSPGTGEPTPYEDFVPSEHPFLVALLTVFLVAFVLIVAFGLWTVVRAVWTGWRMPVRESAPPPQVDFEVLSAPMAAEALGRAVRFQRQVLLRGSARNGIVECWHRFETESIAAGISQHPWETTAEFVLRILDRAEADPAAVATLAGLYREARFSDHAIGEEQRSRALEALERIHAGLTSSAEGPR